MLRFIKNGIAVAALLTVPLALNAQNNFYVKAPCDLTTASTTADGLSWDNAISLQQALQKATAGSNIYVKGYTTDEANGNKDYCYTVPDTKGFVLPSGVRMYGGFKGDEAEIDPMNLDNPAKDKREYLDSDLSRMKYRSVLTADIDYDDVVSKTWLIYPQNTKRTDNAEHVVTMNLAPTTANPNSGNNPTVLNGFFVMGGNASGSYGGGVYIADTSTDDNNTGERGYEVARCFFTDNYAKQGGAVYVASNVKVKDNRRAYIHYNTLYNNVAGTRGADDNLGGGIWAVGKAAISNNVVFCNTNGGMRVSKATTVVNNTITRNTSAGIDLVDKTNDSGLKVYNTVIWGNHRLNKISPAPELHYCAYYTLHGEDAPKGNNNIWLQESNNSAEGDTPNFKNPAASTIYDINYGWKTTAYPEQSFALDYGSALIGKGDPTQYNKIWGDQAISANSRFGTADDETTTTIDIGAYAYSKVSKSRRRYVKTANAGGSDENDGKSWATAFASPQKAIDALNDGTGQRGEVWVAAGTYTPQTHITADNNSPVAFRMYSGINVIGGFIGTEESIEDRKRHNQYTWKFDKDRRTIFQASNYTNPKWNPTKGEWTINSGSYHVVWFAPVVTDGTGSDNNSVEPFDKETILEGVTIEGGKLTSESGSTSSSFLRNDGAGVVMTGNAVLRNCVVRYCSTSADGARGAAVYNVGGRMENCLVYNNVNASGEGGGVYLDGYGLVTRSIIANNKARNGGGVYMKRGSKPQNYNVLALSVIANNENTANGAVYADESGNIINNTIVNNYTSTSTDDSDKNASYTGGLYVNGYCYAVNNIIWNNGIKRASEENATTNTAGQQAQMHAINATTDKVRFYNNALSSPNSAVWNNIYQSGTMALGTDATDCCFKLNKEGAEQYGSWKNIKECLGLQHEWQSIDYYWPTKDGASVRSAGLPIYMFDNELLYHPDVDIVGDVYTTTTIGAYNSSVVNFRPALSRRDGKDVLRLYVDPQGSKSDGDGSSWSNNASSLHEVLEFFQNCYAEQTFSFSKLNVETPTYYAGKNSITINENSTILEVCLRKGNIHPEYSYDDNDANAVSHRIPRTECPLRIVGGYPSADDIAQPTDNDRDIKNNRTEFDGRYTIGALNGNSYHTVRVAGGANVTFDGVAVTGGKATNNATMHCGGGVLLYDGAHVQMDNCIIENNIAYTGPAVAATMLADNVKLVMRNCVVNNNTVEPSPSNGIGGDDPWLFSIKPEYMDFNHVTIVNNIAYAPQNEVLNRNGNTSYAVGNQYPLGSTTACNNTSGLETIASTGKEGAANFSNPSINVGAAESGNVYYGGEADYRPLTSSTAMKAIINKAATTTSDLKVDINNNDRDLGGAPDLGAIEALLPKAGKVIYVRSYNTVAPDNNDDVKDEIDGSPNFNLLNYNPGVVYNGRSWDTAIHGNAMCDTLNMDNNDNSIYVRGSNNILLATTWNNTDYSKYLGTTTTPVRSEPYYGPASGHYTRFIAQNKVSSYTGSYASIWDKYYQGNTNQLDKQGSTYYNSINNDRKERYISGLQLAVEIAAKYNALHKNDPGFEPKEVWVGAGVYTDYKGFVIRNGVKVYGGFPKDGTPSEQERKPLLSQYVPARNADKDRKKSDYETILQIRKESPVYRNAKDELNISGDNGGTNTFAMELVNTCADDKYLCQRHYVLYQPDVCVTTWHVAGDGNNCAYKGNEYRCYKTGSYYWENYVSGDKPSVYKEYADVKWDGFTVRHGYIINYMANRDGGAGVRVFHGVELENLIITNNLTHGYRTRGGGLYMDGANSTISNSFILNNLTTDKNAKSMSNWNDGNGVNGYSYYNFGGCDDYGGGAYMIVGTGYNMVVANNRVISHQIASGSGGGIFIENAKFYNNTVAYNTSRRNGSGIEQWASGGNATGVSSELSLYNCIVYGNKSTDFPDNPQVASTSVSTFKPAHNCFLVGGKNNYYGVWNDNSGGAPENLYSVANENIVIKGSEESANNPFAAGDNASKTNDYRLKEDTKCLNGGTEDLNQNNEVLKVDLPLTDMDYSDRIKDCKVDIGAYESDAYSKYAYETRNDSIVFYVTQNGYGENTGGSPENAACADKLQKVLNYAGKCFKEKKAGTGFSTINKFVVKVAGYDMDSEGEGFVYHPNTLADESDPQSYTFLIPNGVTLMGGFYEGEQQTVTVGTSTTTKLVGYNWHDNKRNVFDEWRKNADGTLANCRTVLSAVAKLPATSSVDNIVGHHAVTFGSWPKGDLQEWSNGAVSDRATIDGCFIINGQAITNDGHKALGGAAIVPKNAHVRNCVIAYNKAVRGGGLYLMPGATVSGSIIERNEAEEGGAIYADNGKTTKGTKDNRAYIISSTIVRNEAKKLGGGLFFEEGAMMIANSVIWGNSAASDKNLSGVAYEAYDETKFYGTTDGNVNAGHEYPFNDCFIETYKLKSNHPNISMESDNKRYFRSGSSFIPRPFSQLIHSGAYNKEMKDNWIKTFDVATHDIRSTQLIVDNLQQRLTVGAFAVHLKVSDELFKRLFVSLDGGNEVPEDIQQKYMGRSFYTPFNSLGNALEYIRRMRSSKKATDETHFEILLTRGTYVPVLARKTTSDKLKDDMRMCSFSIPVNTALYGGFTGKENYCTGTELRDASFTGKPAEGFVADGNMKAILAERNKIENTSTYFVDRNLNNIIEPWEFNSLTILTGDLLNDESKRAYHVVYAEDKNVYPEAEKAEKRQSLGILLDGITIQHGATAPFLDINETTGKETLNEVGHGGGIYSDGVNVTLNRCRLIDNRGIHGGAAFIKDADMYVLGSLVAGNAALADEQHPSEAGKGGAMHFNYENDATYGSFYTANSLYVNNSAEPSVDGTGDALGGAIYFNASDNLHKMYFMNSIGARNKSTQGGGLYCTSETAINGKFAYNSVSWGNVSTKSSQQFLKYMSHMANDEFVNLDPKTDYEDVELKDGSIVRTLINSNILLSKDNMAIDGPRFTKPTDKAGVEGYDLKSQWNPAGISILTDAGDGMVKKDSEGNFTLETGAYHDFWTNGTLEFVQNYFETDYNIDRYMLRRQSGEGSEQWTKYARYLGGINEDGTLADKIIDIGLYEYQYKLDFKKLPGVYVGMIEQGDGDGRDWANQTSDLRNAIIAMANPDGFSSTGQDKKRTIYVRNGQYFSPTLSAGNAFSLHVNQSNNWCESVTIKGACTGEGHGENVKQDFSKQTVIVPSKLPILKAGSLLDISTKNKPVTIEGLTFNNDYGRGMRVQVDDANGSLKIRNGGFRENLGSGMFVAQNKGKVLVYNTLFANNSCMKNIQNESGGAAKVGNDAALVTTGTTTVVNATFAENLGKAVAVSPETTEFGETSLDNTHVYNSVSWQNKDNKTDITQNEDGTTTIATGSIYANGGAFCSDIQVDNTATATNNNKAFAYHYDEANLPVGKINGPENADAMWGPNFTNPAEKDYTLRPSLFLLDRGSNVHYQREVLGYDDAKIASANPAIPETELELANKKRLVGGAVDVGAYEQDAQLRQILYVKISSAENTGESWTKAMGDLQSAIDLAGLYKRINGEDGFVLVDQNVNEDNVKLELDGVHVYGNMNDEKSTKDETTATAEDIVKELLSKRHGAFESGFSMSKIKNLTMNADAVVDGFNITESATIKKGLLGGSLIECNVNGKVAGNNGEGVLYNSLVYDRTWEQNANPTAISQLSVSGLRAVNVTSQGTIENVSTNEANKFNFIPDLLGSYANRAPGWNKGEAVSGAVGIADTIAHTRYVPSALTYRCYQLNEDDNDNLDRWANDTKQYKATQACIDKVGHGYDVLGNKRLRNKLDNGCFETWNVLSNVTGTEADETQTISKNDYPHCPSVVYVRRGRELTIEDEVYPNPGVGVTFNSNAYLAFLLLEHHAGLRSVNNWLGYMRLAVERDFEEGKSQYVYLPFTVDRVVNANNFKAYTYNAKKRAEYDYKFSSENGAWQNAERLSNIGLALVPNVNTNFTARFYSVQEGENPSWQITGNNLEVTLQQSNNRSPWSNPSDGGAKFTHKENMGWNLFGSPYICSMNYGDMEYPRIAYWLDKDGNMKTLNMNLEIGATLTGHIPPFDAVFTQTATLAETEKFDVRQSKNVSGNAYASTTRMAVAISPYGATRQAADGSNNDEFAFQAVPHGEARIDYDLGADGVKWMSVGSPLIYAERNGGRYSLLTALDEDGEVNIGVSVPEAGMYVIGVPEGCNADDYEAVLLKDASTGKAVDLLEGDYSFSTQTEGEQNQRFRISFRKTADADATTIRASRVGADRVRVSGLEADDVVSIYLPNGLLANQAKATSNAVVMTAGTQGVVIVEVTRHGKQVSVRKLK